MAWASRGLVPLKQNINVLPGEMSGGPALGLLCGVAFLHAAEFLLPPHPALLPHKKQSEGLGMAHLSPPKVIFGGF